MTRLCSFIMHHEMLCAPACCSSSTVERSTPAPLSFPIVLSHDPVKQSTYLLGLRSATVQQRTFCCKLAEQLCTNVA